MKLSLLDGLIPTPDPEPLIKPRWGTVTQASPLRVRLDGDTDPLGITPASIVGNLVVSDRVWCVLVGKQLIVLGRNNGAAAHTHQLSGDMGAANLNTFVNMGTYYQPNNAAATTALHYPLASCHGWLEVMDNGTGVRVSQRFTTGPSAGTANKVYVRGYNGTTWSAWIAQT